MDRLEEQEVRATRIINYKTGLPERRHWSTGILKANIESLQDIWDHFRRRHDKLQRKSELRRHPYFTNKVFETTEREYKMILGFLYDEMSRLNQPLRNQMPQVPTAVQRTHLPRVELPKFSGAFEDWESFRDLFTSLIRQDTTLTGVQKLQFLKTSVQGSAKSTLDKLTITEANYEIAWQTLLKRYDNPRILVTQHLSTLASIPIIKREDSTALQDLMDTLNTKKAALRSLDCPVEHWDEIFVFFAVRALDPVTRRDWETSLGDSEDRVLYTKLSCFLQGRIHALKTNKLSKGHKTDSESSRKDNAKSQPPCQRPRHSSEMSFSTTTGPEPSSSKRVECMCNKQHYLATCPDFHSADIKRRRDMVTRLHLCYNCLRGGHLVAECPSMGRCLQCQSKHHTMIHQSIKRKAADAAQYDKNKRERVQNGNTATGNSKSTAD